MDCVLLRSSGRWVALWLAVAMGQGCADPPEGAATAAAVRQGPLRVTCYRDEQVVFEHGTIYRVYRPDGDDAGWSYETGDGLKFRGRIGENVNCVWQ